MGYVYGFVGIDNFDLFFFCVDQVDLLDVNLFVDFKIFCYGYYFCCVLQVVV